jgi:hypothetical protein
MGILTVDFITPWKYIADDDVAAASAIIIIIIIIIIITLYGVFELKLRINQSTSE